MSIEPRQLWTTVYERFDPWLPPARSEWIAPRPRSHVDEIAGALSRSVGTPRFLVAATPGTGTTTELRRLQDRMSGEVATVMLDLVAHFSETVKDEYALQRVTPHEVLLLIGLATLRRGQQLGLSWPKDLREDLAAAWAKVVGEPASEGGSLDVGRLAAALGGLILPGLPDLLEQAGELTQRALEGAGAALEKLADSASWNLRIGGSHPTLTDQSPASDTLVNAVNGLLLHLQGSLSRRVAVIVDGLDRINEVDSVEQLFIRSQLLARLRAVTVYAAPFLFRHSLTNLLVRGVEFRLLGNAQVFDPKAERPTVPGPDIGFFEQLYHRRVADLEGGPETLPGAALRRMALYSGGRVRDFVRMVRGLTLRAYDKGVTVVTEDMVEAEIDALRRQVSHGLNRKHIALLEAVWVDARHQLPDDPEAGELLRTFRLLPYENGDEWYYPHPLLTISLLRRASA